MRLLPKPSDSCSAASVSTCLPGQTKPVIADESVDGEICATDLLGQSEHGTGFTGYSADHFREAGARNPGGD